MQNSPRWLAALAAAALLVIVGTLWIVFAPVQFGGQDGYVIISGNSMEPLYHAGDLVIVRTGQVYQIGDVAAYRHPQIGPVIHRITRRDGLRYVMKGDNNTWLDSYEPLPADFLGKAWIHLGSVGKVFQQVRTPTGLALIAGLAGFVMISAVYQDLAPRPPRRRRRAARREDFFMKRFLPFQDDLLFVLAVIGFGSLILAAFAFTRPLTQTITEEIPYDQKGEFTYTAPAPADLYDLSTIQTGEPAFLQLTDRLHFQFSYHFTSQKPAEVSGTQRLVAEVGDISGWKRTIELQAEQPFQGGTFTAAGDLNLSQVQALIDSLKTQTGLVREYFYVSIVPQVSVTGNVGPMPLNDTFAPRLQFQIDSLVMQQMQAQPGEQDPLTPSQTGLLEHPQTLPNYLSIFSLHLRIASARWTSGIGLALALAGVVALAWLRRKAGQQSEVARIQARYGSLLANVQGGRLSANKSAITVATFDDLAKLAEKDARMILHEAEGGQHHYVVQDGETIYQYSVTEESSPTEGQEQG